MRPHDSRPAIAPRFAAGLLTLAAACMLAGCPASPDGDGPDPTPPDRPHVRQEVWLEDIAGPVKLTDEQLRGVALHLAGRLGMAGDHPLPPAVLADDQPRVVLLSLCAGDRPAVVVEGTDRGLAHALDHAIETAGKRFLDTPRWLKLDIVQSVYDLPPVQPTVPLRRERTLFGLATSRKGHLAILPAEILAHHVIDSGGRVSPRAARMFTLARARRAGYKGVPRDIVSDLFFRFSTRAVYTDGTTVAELYRGNRDPQPLTAETLLARARLGGEYLTRATRRDGSFVYLYQPRSDTAEDSYNILRHAGTIYSMLELHEADPNEQLLAAGRRAIGYLVDQVKPHPTRDGLLCVVEDAEVKLGGNGLAVLALARYIRVTGDRTHLPVLRGLCAWMKHIQQASGRFSVHKMSYPGLTVSGFRSAYYPGEAIYALARAHRLDPNAGWLDVATRAASYRISLSKDKTPPLDHWLLYGLNEVHRLRPDDAYLDHAMAIGERIVKEQNLDPKYPDWLGSFGLPPRTTPAATLMEGLANACELARDYDRPALAAKMRDALPLGVAFALRNQYMPESAMYLRNPRWLVGGVSRQLDWHSVRIDYVQHTMSAALRLRAIMLAEQKQDRAADTSPADR